MPLKIVSDRRRLDRARVTIVTVGAENGKGLFRDFKSQDEAEFFADQVRDQFASCDVPVDVRTISI